MNVAGQALLIDHLECVVDTAFNPSITVDYGKSLRLDIFHYTRWIAVKMTLG